MIRRNGYFWPTMLEDCFTYYKGCQECQKFGNMQRAPASAMNPIIKPWPLGALVQGLEVHQELGVDVPTKIKNQSDAI